MKIAIIDDGVDDHSIPLPVASYIVDRGKVIRIPQSRASAFSHGTACAKIISNNLNNAELISISIYSESAPGNENDLIVSLQWCLENYVDIINLSNGATSYFNNTIVNDLCFKIRCQGTMIVAAVSNEWMYTSPACLPYVVGVSKQKILSRDLPLADIELSGWHFFRDHKGRYHFESHSSFACAKFCNRLARNCATSRMFYQRKVFPQIFDFSLLKNTYVWKLSAEMDTEYLPYHLQEISSSTIGKDEKITLLVSNDFGSEKLYKTIESFENNLLLLIWCDGRIPRRIKDICANYQIPLWAPCIKTQFPFAAAKFSVDAFTIVYDPMQFDLGEILKLKNEFVSLGYNVLPFSSRKFSFLYNVLFENTSKRIQRIVNSILPDVVIVEAPKEKCNFDWDIRIIRSQKNVHIFTNDKEIGEFSDMHSAVLEIIRQFSA